MSAIHLTHLILWKDVVDHCYVYVDPGVKLRVGKNCGRIHLVNKDARLKVENRKYLADKICTVAATGGNCETAVDESTFRKSEKKTYVISNVLFSWLVEKSPPLNRFVDSLSNAIEEFAKTERLKFVGQRNGATGSIDSNELVKTLSENGKWPEDPYWRSCDCALLSLLMEMGDTQTLLSFSDDQIRKALSCLHGGQAVGNYFSFISYHVLHVYVYTNLIAAVDLQGKPDEWGGMKPGGYFRENLMEDCDGQTFLFHSRLYLKDDVYMKDWEAMKELTKNCFRFLYMLDMVRKEVGYAEKPRDYLISN